MLQFSRRGSEAPNSPATRLLLLVEGLMTVAIEVTMANASSEDFRLLFQTFTYALLVSF